MTKTDIENRGAALAASIRSMRRGASAEAMPTLNSLLHPTVEHLKLSRWFIEQGEVEMAAIWMGHAEEAFRLFG